MRILGIVGVVTSIIGAIVGVYSLAYLLTIWGLLPYEHPDWFILPGLFVAVPVTWILSARHFGKMPPTRGEIRKEQLQKELVQKEIQRIQNKEPKPSERWQDGIAVVCVTAGVVCWGFLLGFMATEQPSMLDEGLSLTIMGLVLLIFAIVVAVQVAKAICLACLVVRYGFRIGRARESRAWIMLTMDDYENQRFHQEVSRERSRFEYQREGRHLRHLSRRHSTAGI